jgi:hypothetical protein
VDEAVDAAIAEQEDRQHDVVQHAVVLGRDQPAQQRLARDALQAVLAAGERHLHAKEVDHLREGERDHGEVDALAADCQRARHQADQGGARDAGQEAHFRRHRPDLHHMTEEVTRHAEEHGVAEAHQAGVAQQQVEGAGEQRKAERRHQEHRVGDPRRGERRRGHQDRSEQAAVHLLCPNRPAGLIRSTIAMTTKITVFDAGG